jgi:hypothetical protein
MRNGYALCHRGGLLAIGDHLADRSDREIDALRDRLRIGAHRSVEVTVDRVTSAWDAIWTWLRY